MIVVDANIWIDHFHRANARLQRILPEREALMHPYTIAEIALGGLHDRMSILETMRLLPAAPLARHDEVMQMIEMQGLFNTGIGYVDAHLLASTRLFPGARLWTRDKRLHAQAELLGVAAAA